MKLQKAREGFSFENRALIGYIDDAMTEAYGLPEDNPLWTRENLRTLEQLIIDKIKSKMTK